jgi:hypothetical protein
MCTVKKPKITNPASAQFAAPAKVNPLVLSAAAIKSIQGKGVSATSLRVDPTKAVKKNGAAAATGLQIKKK